ncbi:hypothetical protein ACP70R_005587 [Stipagrostis hirtigluma subsp. patula]
MIATMARGGKPWSSPSPAAAMMAATTVLVLAAILMAARPAAAADRKPDFASCLPANCSDVFGGCTPVGCPVYSAETEVAKRCCEALYVRHEERQEVRQVCAPAGLQWGLRPYWQLHQWRQVRRQGLLRKMLENGSRLGLVVFGAKKMNRR